MRPEEIHAPLSTFPPSRDGDPCPAAAEGTVLWHTLILRAVQRAGATPRPCPRCGHQVPSGESACPGCGAALPVSPPLPGPAGTGRATGWMALAVVLLLLGTMAYLAWRDDPAPPGPPAAESPR